MNLLKERIAQDGKNLGNGILKVDGFINHQVDAVLMNAAGKDFAQRFKNTGADRILTAEISGIAPAVFTGAHMGLPVVYARKHRPVTMPDPIYHTTAPSHTKGNLVNLIVSGEYLKSGEKILIIDDFLASGNTIMGLVDLIHEAGAELVGVGALVEKTFEGGRAKLRAFDIPVETLVGIANMDDGQIIFA